MHLQQDLMIVDDSDSRSSVVCITRVSQYEYVRWMCVCPQEVWLLTRERELKEDLRRQRDKEIELAIFTLEEETSKDKEECERAADNRCVCVCVHVDADTRSLFYCIEDRM